MPCREPPRHTTLNFALASAAGIGQFEHIIPLMTLLTRLLFPALFACLPLVANAETFLLKDGKQLDGRIVEETATDYLIEIQVTASIKDRRRVAKQDVKSVSRPDPAATALEEIAKATPVADNSSLEHYDALLDTKILAFLKNFPKSPKTKEVAELRDSLTAERNLIASGGIKLNGSTYSAAEREANAFDIDAALATADIKAKALRGEFTAALRAFETFEREFSTSTHYPLTVQLAERVLGSYRDGIQQDLEQLETRVANRARGLERIPAEERRRSQALIDQENKSYLALVEREKSAKTQWPSLNPYHPEPMRATLATIAATLTRLQSIKFDEIADGGMAFRSAWRSASTLTTQEDFAAALATLKTAKVPERYLQRVVKKAELTKAATPPPAPAPAPSEGENTPSPETTPETTPPTSPGAKDPAPAAKEAKEAK